MYRFRIFLRRKCFSRPYSSGSGTGQEKQTLGDIVKFYAPHFELKENLMYKFLKQNEFLLELNKDDVLRKLSYLKYVNITVDEILENPNFLQNHLMTIENRTTILRECGFVESLNLHAINKYVTIVRKQIETLKRHRLIPQDLNMYDQLKRQFEIEVAPKVAWDDETELNRLRRNFFSEFLSKRLEMTEQDLGKLWKSYDRIQHKCFGHTQRVIDILQYDYQFSRDKIVANMFLLHADPENLLRFPEMVPTIAGRDIKEVFQKRPKIMMTSCDSLKEILGYLKAHEVAEDGLLMFSSILTLSPQTIENRLMELKNIKEFDVLAKHPRILKLVMYQTKASIRLHYLQQLKMRCVSLDVLSTNSKNFEKYVRDGCDKTKGRDTTYYLKRVFGSAGENDIKKLKRHPNWYHVPTAQMQQTFELLKSRMFTVDDIRENIHVLLYPLSRIEGKLTKLIESKNKKHVHEELGIDLYDANRSQLLALCMYLMELEFHFTGDGVWPEQTQQSDSNTAVTIELPKTLSKEYKYGKKPPISILAT